MGIYDSVMQGLNEAVEHQQGRGQAKIAKLTAKAVSRFHVQKIKAIRTLFHFPNSQGILDCSKKGDAKSRHAKQNKR